MCWQKNKDQIKWLNCSWKNERRRGERERERKNKKLEAEGRADVKLM